MQTREPERIVTAIARGVAFMIMLTLVAVALIAAQTALLSVGFDMYLAVFVMLTAAALATLMALRLTRRGG